MTFPFESCFVACAGAQFHLAFAPGPHTPAGLEDALMEANRRSFSMSAHKNFSAPTGVSIRVTSVIPWIGNE